MTRTAGVVRGLLGEFRQLDALGVAAGGVGVLALVFGAGAWGARLGWFSQPSWVLLVWAIGVLLLGAALQLYRRRRSRLSPAWLAHLLESTGFRRGALGGLLEPAAAGTSPALLEAADDRQAAELAARAPALLPAQLAPFRRRALQGGAALLLGVGLLLSARPTSGNAGLLWRPLEAWAATRAPLRLTLSATEVDRGAAVTVDAEARGRQHAILWVRSPGEAWRGTGLVLDSTGHAHTTLGPLDGDLFLRLSSGGASSDTLQVRVRLPAFLGSLALTARYPRYLGLEDEPVPTNGDTVVVPEGTALETTGEATAALTGAVWDGAGAERLVVDGTRFRGRFVPHGSRVWTLALTTASGQSLVGDTIRVPVVTVPDSAPRVDVPLPGQDTLIPLTLRVPLVIDAADDHGLTRVLVESHRVSRLGFADPARVETVPLPGQMPDRAVLPYPLDLNGRGLVPGDTVRFRVTVIDNAPTAHLARSREYVLRLPTTSEIRDASREAAGAVARRLDSVTQAAKKLERQTADLAEERPRASSQANGGTDESLSYENAQRAEAVAQNQEELLRQATEVQKSIDALRQSAEAAGLNDPAWQQRLQEIQSQLERAMTPELRQRLAELQQALKDLDPERTREALDRLAEAQQQLREALERSKELFERAALEGDLANLQAEAHDLAEAQKQWNQQVPAVDSARSAAEQRALAARTDSLRSALERLADQMAGQQPAQAAEPQGAEASKDSAAQAGGDTPQQPAGGEQGQKSPSGQPNQQNQPGQPGQPPQPGNRQEGMQQAAQQAQRAAQQQRQAAKSASQGQKSQARQQGQQAEQELDPLDDQLQQQREEMQQEWKQEVVQALDRAMADATRLANRQLQVSDALRRGETSAGVRSEQGAIEEGVERLLQQVQEAAGKNALVSPQSSVALAAGRDKMRQAREAISSAAPNSREASRQAGEAVDALNAAAMSLLRSRGAVDGAGSGSGLQEAMQQMQQMANQQGQLGQQSGGMLPMMGQGGGQMQEQLRQLGAQQRALSEQLERMRAGGQLPGTAEMAQEAKELARTLEAGRLDRQTVERQERLFRRMLDAGRTLQGQEEDDKKERQSSVGDEANVQLPPALRARLDAGDALLRLPSWEELQRLAPDDRRRVVEYFRRLGEKGSGTGVQGSGSATEPR